jgi:hypothetical protein
MFGLSLLPVVCRRVQKMTKSKFPHLFPPLKMIKSNVPSFFRHKKWQSSNFRTFSNLKNGKVQISELFHSEFRTLFGIFCYGYLRYLCLFVFIVVSTQVFTLFVFVCIYSSVHTGIYVICVCLYL